MPHSDQNTESLAQNALPPLQDFSTNSAGESNRRPVLTRRHSMPAHTGSREERYEWSYCALRDESPLLNEFLSLAWNLRGKGRSYHSLLMAAENTLPQLRTHEHLRILRVQEEAEQHIETLLGILIASKINPRNPLGLNRLLTLHSKFGLLATFAEVYSNIGEDKDALAHIFDKLDIRALIELMLEEISHQMADIADENQELISIVHDLTGSGELQDVELENVGPDPDVNELGTLWIRPQGEDTGLVRDEKSDDRAPEMRCCVCLEVYHEGDPSFQLSRCKHIVGRNCAQDWISSTSKMSHTCMQCRKPLLPPREHRPKPETREMVQVRERHRTLEFRFGEFQNLINQLNATIHNMWPYTDLISKMEDIRDAWIWD
ncbi:hypothetical protein BU16DRAFT_196115 [Lophium mytilinum]|uniref:RING-type domain-containing protein n=1 Tax=Lophium mytilinum TaxID=390894 RepID=A0A6A6R9A2_9PEZI|nr:hypothetical protein BU16DRAFT_196115 [Lophium mytilinum]